MKARLKPQESCSPASAAQLSNLQIVGQYTPGLHTASLQIPCAAIGAIFAATDAALIVLASLVGAKGYELFVSGSQWNLKFHVAAGIAAAVLYLMIGRSSGYYQASNIFSLRPNTAQILWHWLITSLLLALLAFLWRIGIQFSRGSIICFAVVALAALFASRALMKRALTLAVIRGRVQGRRVVVVGLLDELAAVGKDDLLRRFGLTEVERVILPREGNWSLAANKGILTSLDRAMALARDLGAEEMVLAHCWNDSRGIELVRDRLRGSPLRVQLLPDQRVRYLTENLGFSANHSLAIEIQRPPLSRLEQLAKRALDVAGACCALILVSPLMLLTALTIKLESPGPVIFRQQRSGFNAKRFLIYKFRTMSVSEEGDSVTQATRDDPG